MFKHLLLIVLCLLPLGLTAQTQPKFGYMNYAEVLKSMPQYAEAETNLAILRSKYDAEIRRSEDEFTRKYAEFLQEQKDFPHNIMVKRHKELQELMEKSIAFKNEINATLETARDKMLEPLTAVAIGVLYFGEPLTIAGIAGMALVIIAVMIVVIYDGKRPTATTPIPPASEL